MSLHNAAVNTVKQELAAMAASKRTTTDPLIREAKKAYRSTVLFEVDRLLEEQSRWMRKRTIAENKLSDVRRRIDAKLEELATPKSE